MKLLIKLIPMLGISFWFLLLFPFGNRNEGYQWAAYFERFDFFEIMVNPIPSIITLRPLAQILSWLLYHASGSNVVFIQALNFSLLCVAFVVIAEFSKNIYTKLLYFIVGFIFISSFYYIFNIHGIFYSPIILMVALLIRYSKDVFDNWKSWIALSFILIFFHPYIAIVYLTFIAGLIIEKGKYSKIELQILVVNIIILLTPVFFLNEGTQLKYIAPANLIGAFRNVEANSIVQVLLLVLLITLVMQKEKFERILYLSISIIYFPLALYYELPFLLLVAFVLMSALFFERNWSLLGLVVASILFPLLVKSGAPTKVSLFLFLIPYAVSRNLVIKFKRQEALQKLTALATPVCILIVVVIIRTGFQIPFVSSFIKPLLVEKGKSKQLVYCIENALAENTGVSIKFLQDEAGKIRDQGQPKKRDNIPVTKQSELDEYLNVKESRVMSNTWYVSFGEPVARDSLILYMTIEEINTKPLFVYSTQE